MEEITRAYDEGFLVDEEIRACAILRTNAYELTEG